MTLTKKLIIPRWQYDLAVQEAGSEETYKRQAEELGFDSIEVIEDRDWV